MPHVPVGIKETKKKKMLEYKEVIGCQVTAVRWLTHQFDILVGQKGAGLSRCVRACIVMLINDSSSLVRFSNFSEDFWQTNCGVALRIDRSKMLKWNSRDVTSFATICFEVLLPPTTFVELDSSSKTLTGVSD